jgi:hypothetical protein
MATSKKTTTAKTSVQKEPEEFYEAYIRLRTVLDALEISALRYCLTEKDEKTRVRQANKIVKALKPLVKRFQNSAASSGPGGTCEDGFFNCNGVCVPYQCPEGRES